MIWDRVGIMPKIFISYRREDSKHVAGRLHEALKRHVRDPRRDIFIDIDNIPVGVDFIQHLDSKVAECDVLFALIGSGWLKSGEGMFGGRRLDDSKDVVRIEIAAALKRGIPVAPVLVDGAPMPKENELPDDLKPLVRRQGVHLRHETFAADAERMIRGLGLKELGRKPKPTIAPASRGARPAGSSGSWMAPVVALSVLALTGGGAWAWFANPGDWRGLEAAAWKGAGGSNDRDTLAAYFERYPKGPHADEARSGIARLDEAAERLRDPAKFAARVAAAGKAIEDRTFRDCSDCPQMVAIPSGSFLMGSPASETGRSDNEGPQRRVSVPAFAVGKYEVTWAEWDRCVTDGSCASLKADGFGGGSRPVTNVSWTEAVAYTKWLSRETEQAYRLPSEAEWEYAARAGTTTAYSFGNTITESQANYYDLGKTTPVGQHPANAFGLHDMHGNVWEWVEDCYEGSYSAGQASDGSAYTTGVCLGRVNRGGSVKVLLNIRSASRYGGAPTNRNYGLGFRVARTLFSS
jgi:formylglycine-generating enzyme required for sulfatase activity